MIWDMQSYRPLTKLNEHKYFFLKIFDKFWNVYSLFPLVIELQQWQLQQMGHMLSQED